VVSEAVRHPGVPKVGANLPGATRVVARSMRSIALKIMSRSVLRMDIVSAINASVTRDWSHPPAHGQCDGPFHHQHPVLTFANVAVGLSQVTHFHRTVRHTLSAASQVQHAHARIGGVGTCSGL